MIQRLTQGRAQHLQELRQQMIASDPNSFLSTCEFESQFSLNYYQNQIISRSNHPSLGVFAYLSSDEITGIVTLQQDYWPKKHHIANLYELYVVPKRRSQGVAGQLIQHCISQAIESQTIEQIHLRVNSSNTNAIKLYQKHHFTHLATINQAVKNNETYQGEELFCYHLPKPISHKP